jgi:hypothetical protein
MSRRFWINMVSFQQEAGSGDEQPKTEDAPATEEAPATKEA